LFGSDFLSHGQLAIELLMQNREISGLKFLAPQVPATDIPWAMEEGSDHHSLLSSLSKENLF